MSSKDIAPPDHYDTIELTPKSGSSKKIEAPHDPHSVISYFSLSL